MATVPVSSDRRDDMGCMLRWGEDGLPPVSEWQHMEQSFLQGNSEVMIDRNTHRYIQTDVQEDAMELLTDRGVVLLCGPPGSGKTTTAHAVLRRCRNEGFTPFVLSRLEEWHSCVGEGERSVVLLDGTLGMEMVKRQQHDYWESILDTVLELVRNRQCQLVITLYPHVLRQLRRVERSVESPLSDPSLVVHMPPVLDDDVKDTMLRTYLKGFRLQPETEHQLVETILQKDVSGPVFPWCCDYLLHHWLSSDEPTAIFTVPAMAYVTLLTRLLSDPKHGEIYAAVLALTMKGIAGFLHNFREVQRLLKELRFQDYSEYRLEEHAASLKGLVLSEHGCGFTSRVIYEAVGLALGRDFSLPVVLQVCDAAFLSKYVRTERGQFCVYVADDVNLRHALIQKMYSLMTQGFLAELCCHPSFRSVRFLREFGEFCLSQKNRVHRLLNAVDTKHGLSLMYWSVWNSAPHFSHWCLTTSMDQLSDSSKPPDGLLSSALAYISTRLFDSTWLSHSLLSAALAYVLFPQDGDDTRNGVKVILQTLHRMSLKTTLNNTIKVSLPMPNIHAQTKPRCSEMKTQLLYSGACYLNNSALTIPRSLMSVMLSEDLVTVELPAQHWYLVLRLLADREVDETDQDGNTVLHLASCVGQVDAIQLAVKSGASLFTKNHQGLTPCQLAQKRNKTKYKQDTMLDLNVDVFAASWNDDVESVKVMLCVSGRELEVEEKNGLLYSACLRGSTDLASLWIQMGADTEVRGEWGITPLHRASASGDVDTVMLLLLHGAEVNVKDDDNFTPLHHACVYGKTQAAELLMTLEADVNQPDRHGLTSLHWACWRGLTEVVHVLLRHNADLHVRCKDTDTALHKACQCGHYDVIRLLLRHQADISVTNVYGMTPLDYAVMLPSCRQN